MYDRTVFKGSAFAIPNTGMKHYSRNTRTVFLTFNQPVCGQQTLVATVSKSRSINSGSVPVTVRRRLFGAPRIHID